MLKKLRLKFVLVNMLIVLLMLLTIFATVFYFTRANLHNQCDALLQQLAQNAHSPISFREPERNMQLPYFTLNVTIHGSVSASGYSYYDLSDEEFLRELVEGVFTEGRSAGHIAKYDLRYKVVPGLVSQTVIFVDVSSQRAALNTLVQVSFLIGAVSLAIFFGISVLLAHWAVKPVERAWQQQTQFVSDASHELKTPLTVIMSNGELLASPDSSETEKKQFAENILSMTRKMRTLVEGLLELSRAENGKSQKTFETVDFSQLVQESVLPFEPVLFENGQRLKCDIQPGISVVGSSQNLSQILAVLLDNAAKYAEPGWVDVKLERQGGGSCLLSVASPGNPIPKEKLESVFDRFFRCDAARTGNGGFGLGLSIAKSLTENHGGKIWAESNQTGNCFFVRFPCR